MGRIVGVSLILVTVVVGLALYALNMPFNKYKSWVSGSDMNSYYEITNFRDLYLSPTELAEIPPYQEDYVQLWKEFPLRNSIIPMPTRHPLYQTVPIVELGKGETIPNFGMILLDPNGREISRVYTMPNRLYQDQSRGQELFKLPYFRKRILKKTLDELWNDIFSHNIVVKKKSVDEMIYDLYILHIRSRILPPETVRYGLIKNGKQAMVELASPDKDYIVELVMIQQSGSIFSYVLKTEKNRPESMKLRSKFLQSITLSPIDESIGRFLYTEFKQMNYARQVDQEGMLYLFSAWSQNPENVDLLKEMIYYLERGQNTKKQLKPIYQYSFARYKKTFTTRRDVDDESEPELSLQRKIEIEAKENRQAAEAASNKLPETIELTPDEKMNLYLKKAKEDKPKEATDMTVH